MNLLLGFVEGGDQINASLMLFPRIWVFVLWRRRFTKKKKKIYFEFQHHCLCVVRQVPTRDLSLHSASLLLIQSFILIFNIVKIASVTNDSL